MTPDEAIAEQLRLAPSVVAETPAGFEPRVAAGLDVAYLGDTGRLVAAVACVDLESGQVVDSAVVTGTTDFPYVPGLFAYRELPSLIQALAAVTTAPDVLVCDGHGLAHPRRFGLACHLGVTTGIPTIGVGKNSMGDYEPPARPRGSWTALIDGTDEVGRALRTQDGVKPIFVSVGHRIDLDTATALVLRLSRKYRQPETTRAADHLCREALKLAESRAPEISAQSALDDPTRSLLGITVTVLWRLATVSADGTIPLPGTLVLESPVGFVTLSYAQEGLACRGPVRRADLRWDTEPDLVMDNRGGEEWLGLVPLEDRANVPELPLFIEAVTGWFGSGAYLDVFALILTGRGRSLVVMTTDDFDLRCTTREEARARADKVAASMNLVLTEREQRL